MLSKGKVVIVTVKEDLHNMKAKADLVKKEGLKVS